MVNLVPCGGCGQKVSPAAAACPACGHPAGGSAGFPALDECPACGRDVDASRDARVYLHPVYAKPGWSWWRGGPSWEWGGETLTVHASCMSPAFDRELCSGRALGFVCVPVARGVYPRGTKVDVGGDVMWVGRVDNPKLSDARRARGVKVGVAASLVAAALLGAWWYSQRPAAAPAEKAEAKKATPPAEKKAAGKRAAPAPAAPVPMAEQNAPFPDGVLFGEKAIYDAARWGIGTSFVDTLKTHAGPAHVAYFRADDPSDLRVTNVLSVRPLHVWLPTFERGLIARGELSVVVGRGPSARSFSFSACMPPDRCAYELTAAAVEGSEDLSLHRSARTGNLFVAVTHN